MFKLHNGDIFEAPVKIICQQCNCQNTMGTGIAKLIKEKFHPAWEADCKAKSEGKNTLGNISVGTDGNLYIVNIYGQDRYGRDKRYTNYEGLYNGIEKVLEFSKTMGCPPIGFPWKMSCNNAGGNWNIVSCMIKEIFVDYPNDILICKI